MAALTVAVDAAGGEVILGLDAKLELTDDGHVAGVSNPAVTFRAPRVVIAAGAWTRRLPGCPPRPRRRSGR